MPNDNEEVVELFYNYKKYAVKKSDIDNKHNKIIILPDGTALDLTQMYIDATDRHGNKLERPCFRGSNPEYEVWGRLPVVGVIEAKETISEHKLKLPPKDINPNENIFCDYGDDD
ncbi:MAG: hypothetical protein HYX21_00985 [Candidatus Yanofskybacteria bacterium]|nr:hypothetical protein [Candidatus Yanofskybacteria bacterium]